MARLETYPRRGLHGELVHRLGLQIVGGELLPGSQIAVDGDSIAGLAVSRTVVRETIRVLASKGLIESKQYFGTRVRPRADWHLLDADVLTWVGEVEPDPDLLRGLTELRFVIEPGAARFAAERATEEQVAKLAMHYTEMVETTSDPVEFAAADIRFHSTVLVSAHNAFLEQFDTVIAAALAGTRARITSIWASRRGTKALTKMLPLHEAVLDAIAARRPDAAEEAMRGVVMRALADLALIDEELAGRRR